MSCYCRRWDAKGELLADDAPDELIYESVKQTIETLAPGGGYAFCGGFMPEKQRQRQGSGAAQERSRNEGV
jgi:hypothetical protein